jgi:hypothetical protein
MNIMTKNKETKYLGKIDHINVYFNSSIEDKNIIYFGRKGKEIEHKGVVYVPIENYKNCKGSAIEKIEVDKILKLSIKNIKYEDYSFCIGCSEDLNVYQNFINIKFKNK